MAKKSKIAKYHKQLAMIEQYAPLRQQLKRNKDYQALAQLPKDANPNRLKRRDHLDGRPRGVICENLVYRELILDNWLIGG